MIAGVKALTWIESIRERARVLDEDKFCNSKVRNKAPTENEERMQVWASPIVKKSKGLILNGKDIGFPVIAYDEKFTHKIII